MHARQSGPLDAKPYVRKKSQIVFVDAGYSSKPAIVVHVRESRLPIGNEVWDSDSSRESRHTRLRIYMSVIILNRSLCRIAFTISLAAGLTATSAAQQPVEQVVQSAKQFLSTLSDAQRSKVIYDFNDKTQQARWSNFPTGFVARGGISLKQMSAAQKAAALDLMKTVLSPSGYQKVTEVRMADDDFKTNGSKRGPRGGGPPPGGRPQDANGGPPPPGCGWPSARRRPRRSAAVR
jgi:hypothetical protein